MRGFHPNFNGGKEVEVRAVRPTDIRVGMVIIGWTTSGKRIDRPEWTDRLPGICDWDGPYRVTEVLEDMVRGMSLANEYTSPIVSQHQDIWLFVVDETTSVGDFPHPCPLCGRAAYVGFMRIDHAVAGACPNR